MKQTAHDTHLPRYTNITPNEIADRQKDVVLKACNYMYGTGLGDGRTEWKLALEVVLGRGFSTADRSFQRARKMLWRAQYQDVDTVHAFRELANAEPGGYCYDGRISRRRSESWLSETDTARIPHGNPVATIS